MIRQRDGSLLKYLTIGWILFKTATLSSYLDQFDEHDDDSPVSTVESGTRARVFEVPNDVKPYYRENLVILSGRTIKYKYVCT